MSLENLVILVVIYIYKFILFCIRIMDIDMSKKDFHTALESAGMLETNEYSISAGKQVILAYLAWFVLQHT